MSETAETVGFSSRRSNGGSEFSAVKHDVFDSVYMKSLFDYGYRLARDGTVWHKAPPGESEYAK